MLMRCARVDRERAYDRLLWDDEVADLGGLFSRKYRMSLSTFSALADELRGDLHRVEVQAVRRYGRPERGVWSLAAETQLAVALRFFAGGSYLDVCSSHKLHYSTFYVTLHRVIKAIHKNLGLSGNLHSVDGRTALSDTFRAAVPGNPLASHTVGALDGIAIHIRGPSVTETSKPAEFFGRKGFFSLNVQAVCDGHCRFIYANTAAPGSMHDSAAWCQSRLVNQLESGALNMLLHFLIGDDAFAVSDSLLAPWPGQVLPVEQDAFNFYLSQLR